MVFLDVNRSRLGRSGGVADRGTGWWGAGQVSADVRSLLTRPDELQRDALLRSPHSTAHIPPRPQSPHSGSSCPPGRPPNSQSPSPQLNSHPHPSLNKNSTHHRTHLPPTPARPASRIVQRLGKTLRAHGRCSWLCRKRSSGQRVWTLLSAGRITQLLGQVREEGCG